MTIKNAKIRNFTKIARRECIAQNKLSHIQVYRAGISALCFLLGMDILGKSELEKIEFLKKELGIKYQHVEHKKSAPSKQKKKRRSKPGKLTYSGDVTSSEFLQSYEWRKLRLIALKLHGSRCQCCGASPKEGAVMNVDHIKPRKTHPELALTLNNLQVLCHECNHGKGNWDTTDFRTK